MDALEFLKHDHQTIIELLEQAESTKDGTKQTELFRQIKRALEIHARNEEAIFHSSLQAPPMDIVLESCGEDIQMKTLLREMEDLVFKLNVLKSDVERHADNEEDESVPKMRDLDEAAPEKLGNQIRYSSHNRKAFSNW
jgi:hemerythrin superfamily protein